MSLSRYDPAGLDVASTTPMIIEYASVTTISIIAFLVGGLRMWLVWHIFTACIEKQLTEPGKREITRWKRIRLGITGKEY